MGGGRVRVSRLGGLGVLAWRDADFPGVKLRFARLGLGAESAECPGSGEDSPRHLMRGPKEECPKGLVSFSVHPRRIGWAEALGLEQESILAVPGDLVLVTLEIVNALGNQDFLAMAT